MGIKEKITEQYRKTLSSNKTLKKQVECIANKLNVNQEIFLDGFIRYDTELGSYDNSIYADLSVKAGMYFKFFVEESYHFERQNILANMVQSCPNTKSIVDIGYGVPGKYVLDALKDKNVAITLLDKFDVSNLFSKALFSCVSNDWKKYIALAKFDMDKNVSPGVFDVYVMSDSIEHTKNPDLFLERLLENAPDHAYFILSIPIEKAEISGGSEEGHVHFIEWRTKDEARKWLKQKGLEILEEKVVKPTDGDYWLEDKDTFYNLIVKTSK